ncbi:hypothetical protein O181_004631 [Austropuccinia psidii MF-1]|uniref:Uncharacterized protein n=1 Tax=Austropuccinia psidii MF-1 TaxID=1389203 RepID=A0A9Q3BHA5_9BASI|nr:hypothetical protein [Austropuccinia psidii MF-1]
MDNTPVQIKAVTRFPSGTVRSFTRTRSEEKWLLLNENTYTHLADPNFVTSPITYPILARSFPTSLDVEDERNVNKIFKQK